MQIKFSQIKNNVSNSVKSMLKNGVSPMRITLCIALGVTLGIFPILGMTTLLCTIAAVALRLNMPAIQMVNFLVYPLQLVLLAPFYGIGSWLFNQPDWLVSQGNLIDLIRNDFWGSMASLWDLTLYAILTWLAISPFIVLVLYFILKPVILSFTRTYMKLQAPSEYVSRAKR